MALSSTATLREVVQVVSRALRNHHVKAVLTGGACASLHSRGRYLSQDLDYVIQGAVTRLQLDRAMASVGFEREGAQYTHPETPFFVEFPAGPLAIGDDDLVEPVEMRVGTVSVLALSATDSCRDRLAAFYYWNDIQSLRVAADIAIERRVDLKAIRRWSVREGRAAEFNRFETEVRVRRDLHERARTRD
jgi:hypothetical protein